MKKVMLVAVGVMFLISCKKDYTCTCTLNGAEISSETINDTKSKAKERCDEGDATIAIPGFPTITTECEIQ